MCDVCAWDGFHNNGHCLASLFVQNGKGINMELNAFLYGVEVLFH